MPAGNQYRRQNEYRVIVFEGMKQREAAHTYNYGLQHFAIYVDDLSETARNIFDAGGKLYAEENLIQAIRQ